MGSKSINLVEKQFNSKLKGEYNEPVASEIIFTELYINKHYSKSLHYIPSIRLDLREIKKKSNALFGYSYTYTFNIADYNKQKLYNLKKDKKEFEKYYKLFKDTDKRFTYFPISQREIFNDILISSHAIFCIYDKLINQIELFDSNVEDFFYYKNFFNKFFKNIYGKNIKIIYPDQNCYFFSEIELNKCKKRNYIYNSTGYCGVWSLWYLELRLKNTELTREEVLNKSLTLLKKGNQKICRLIRGYAQFIQEITGKYELKTENGKVSIIVKNKTSIKNYIIPKKIIILFGISGAIMYILKKLNLFPEIKMKI